MQQDKDELKIFQQHRKKCQDVRVQEENFIRWFNT